MSFASFVFVGFVTVNSGVDELVVPAVMVPLISTGVWGTVAAVRGLDEGAGVVLGRYSPRALFGALLAILLGGLGSFSVLGPIVAFGYRSLLR